MWHTLSSSFDWPGIAERVFEDGWDDLNQREKDLAARTFREMTARQFAVGLEGSERVTVTGSEVVESGSVLVTSTLRIPRKADQSLQWLVVETPRGRRIHDIVFDDRSSVAIFRVLIDELVQDRTGEIEKALADFLN